MEHKEFLEQKLKSLQRKFEKNKELAMTFMNQKKIVDEKLRELVDAGSLIAAKTSAIKEMLNE